MDINTIKLNIEKSTNNLDFEGLALLQSLAMKSRAKQSRDIAFIAHIKLVSIKKSAVTNEQKSAYGRAIKSSLSIGWNK